MISTKSVAKWLRKISKRLNSQANLENSTDHHSISQHTNLDNLSSRNHLIKHSFSHASTHCSQFKGYAFIRIHPYVLVAKWLRLRRLKFAIAGVINSQADRCRYIICADPKTGKILGRIKQEKFEEIFGRLASVLEGGRVVRPGDGIVDNRG